jgi:hypothetical protein
VEGALGAVRRLGAKRRAEVERGRQILAYEPHEGVPEAVDAAVAPAAGVRLVADGRGGRGVAEVDLRRDPRDEAVREARRATGLVGLRQVGHQVLERDLVRGGVLASNGVHEPVTLTQKTAARVGVGGDGDLLERRRRIVRAAHARGERRRVAGAGLLAVGNGGAVVQVGLGLRRLRRRRRIGHRSRGLIVALAPAQPVAKATAAKPAAREAPAAHEAAVSRSSMPEGSRTSNPSSRASGS